MVRINHYKKKGEGPGNEAIEPTVRTICTFSRHVVIVVSQKAIELDPKDPFVKHSLGRW